MEAIKSLVKSLNIDAREIFFILICKLKSLLLSPMRIIYNYKSLWPASTMVICLYIYISSIFYCEMFGKCV